MRPLCRSLSFVFLSTFLSAIAFADCTAPSSPGVRICSPTANSTVSYMPAIDFNSTPAFGAQITKFIVYDNDQLIYQGYPGQSGAVLFDPDFRNGTNRLVINAWDTQGNLYKGTATFQVIGDGYPAFCDAPASPGVNFCVPPNNAVLGTSYSVSATAKGSSKITTMRLYVDGKSQVTSSGSNQLSTVANAGKQGDHTVAFLAWDSAGNVYKSTRVIRTSYTYGFVSCPPKGNDPCSPGFDTDAMPVANSYVGNSFDVAANIYGSPNTITLMQAYVDGTVVASANGPSLNATVDGAPDGTHIFTLQATDSQGIIYRVQYNVNINVQH